MRRRPDRRRRLGIRLSLATLALAGAIALATPGQPESGHDGSLSVSLADGTLSHDNSRDGAAILSASGIWPGWSGDGDVTITNDGSAGSWLRLTQASVDDVPGPGAGNLGGRLQLAVEDVSVPGFPIPLYSGPLAAVGERWLGRMEPGEARTYRFHTAMPSLPDDNDYQGSALTTRFEWALSDTEPGSPPDPDPDPDPPGGDPPVTNPPDSPVKDPPIQVIPDGPPVVIVNRGKLNVKLAIPATQRPIKRRSLLALASCSRSCRATFTGRMAKVRPSAGGIRMAGVSRALSAGIQERVRLRMTRRAVNRAKRLLSRGYSVRGRVSIVARDNSGRVVRATQRIRLVPAPGRRGA